MAFTEGKDSEGNLELALVFLGKPTYSLQNKLLFSDMAIFARVMAVFLSKKIAQNPTEA